MESNLLHPYNYYLSDNSIYEFETDNGITYTAYFIAMPYFETCEMYSFCFEKGGDGKCYDPRIAVTISRIIVNFFEYNNRAVIFTCENCDNKSMHRDKLFYRWFRNYSGDNFIKYDKCIGTAYTSIISLNSNDLNRAIVDEFNQYCIDVNNEEY